MPEHDHDHRIPTKDLPKPAYHTFNPEDIGKSWRDILFHNPQILADLVFKEPPIDSLRKFDKKNKSVEELRTEVQESLDETGQQSDIEVKGKDKHERKQLLREANRLEKKIQGLEKGSKKEDKLKKRFEDVNQKLIDSYNKQIKEDDKKLTIDNIKAREDLGLKTWNVTVPHSKRTEKKAPGFEMAKTIVRKYMGEVPLDKGENLDPLSIKDLRLLLKYYLSGESLTSDDKDLLLHFMRQYVSETDTQNEVFGYGNDKVNPDKYITLMKDPDLMSKEDKEYHRLHKTKGWRKKMRQERRADRKEARADFRDTRKTIRNTDYATGKEKRDAKKANRVERRHNRHERKENASDERLDHSLHSHYMQLTKLNDEIVTNLGVIKKEHKSEGERDGDAEILKKKDERAPVQGPWATLVLDVLDEMSNTESDDWKAWDITEKEKKGFDLQQLIQIYPEKYREAFELQKKIGETTNPTDLAGYYWEAYNKLYLQTGQSTALIGNYADQNALASAIQQDPKLLDELLGGTFNRKYLDGTKLKDPNDVYLDLLTEFGKAALTVLPERSGLSRLLSSFEERYLKPLIVPLSIAGGAGFLSGLIYGFATKDYTSLGGADMIPLSFGGDISKIKFGKTVQTTSWFLDNKFSKLGMPSSVPNFANFGKTPSVSLKGGFRYENTEKEKNELKRQILVQGMLMIDTILGNDNTDPNSQVKKINPVAQLDYIRKNLTSLSISEMKDLLSDPQTFMNAATIQSPDLTVWDFRAALNAKYKTKNVSLSGTAVGGVYDAFGGDPKFSFATMGHVSGNWNVSKGAKIKIDSDLRAMFMTGDKPKFDLSLSGTWMQKVRIHETNFGYYMTLGGKYSTYNPAELYIKGGAKIPISDKYTLGTEVELHYDMKDHFKIVHPYFGAKVYLEF